MADLEDLRTRAEQMVASLEDGYGVNRTQTEAVHALVRDLLEALHLTRQERDAIKLQTLREVHDHWEFNDDTEAVFDDWMHEQIKAAWALTKDVPAASTAEATLATLRQERDQKQEEAIRACNFAAELKATLTRLQSGGYVQHLKNCGWIPRKGPAGAYADHVNYCTCGLPKMCPKCGHKWGAYEDNCDCGDQDGTTTNAKA